MDDITRLGGESNRAPAEPLLTLDDTDARARLLVQVLAGRIGDPDQIRSVMRNAHENLGPSRLMQVTAAAVLIIFEECLYPADNPPPGAAPIAAFRDPWEAAQ